MAIAPCAFDGSTEMYGLGIRTAAYILWFSTVLVQGVNESETSLFRLINFLFSTAFFLSLVIQTALNTLRAVEIYIVILLAFGPFYLYAPLYLWRLITCCSPTLDPGRWPKVPASPIARVLSFALLVGLVSFQMWFWCTAPPLLMAKDIGCREYAFLFAQVELGNSALMAINIILMVVYILCCLAILCNNVGFFTLPWKKELKRKHRHKIR
jgi:hypothetical protein